MLTTIKNLVIRAGDADLRILGLQFLLCSVATGSSLHSWPVFCLILLSLSWILNRRRGLFYSIFIFGACWSVVSLIIGYQLGVWELAWMLGILFFLFGLAIHFGELKQPGNDPAIQENNNPHEWGQDWPWAHPNQN